MVTVFCWALWIVLGVTLAALFYVAVAHELPVPGFLLRRAEAELAQSGLTLKFGRARFDPTGKLPGRDSAYANLQVFLVYVRKVYALIEWIGKNSAP